MIIVLMVVMAMVRSDSGCSLAPRRTPFYWPHSRVTPLRCCIVYVHCRVALDINCKTYIFLYFVIDFGSLTLSTEHFGRSAFYGFHCPSDDDDVGVVEVVVFELVTFWQMLMSKATVEDAHRCTLTMIALLIRPNLHTHYVQIRFALVIRPQHIFSTNGVGVLSSSGHYNYSP